MPTEEPRVISSGVDWITGVTTEPHSSMLLSLHTAGLVSYQKAIGGIEKPWGMAGFSGFKCGDVEYGVRGDEFMVRLMSDAAQLSWKRVYELSDNCTRFDVQVTVDMGRDCQDLVWSYYRRANAKSAKKKRGPKNRVILGNDGGATLYCGERTSNRFGRVYAKGPQTKMEVFKTCLRFEVQYNSRLAKVVSAAVDRDRSSFSSALHRSVQFFESRIGNLPIRTAQVYNDSCPRKRSDCDKKLEWLSTAVRPSVSLLVQRGRLREVLEALGLERVVQSDDRKVGP